MRAFGRLAALSLAICALATAVPVSAQKVDERSTTVSMQAAAPHVTAFAADSMQSASPIMRTMQYVDSMPASTFYSSILLLAASVVMVLSARSMRMRNGGGDEDDGGRWRNRTGFFSAMSASPGGGY